MLVLLGLLATSAAAEPALPTTVAWTQASEELIIEASSDLTQARQALDQAVRALGFRRQRQQR